MDNKLLTLAVKAANMFALHGHITEAAAITMAISAHINALFRVEGSSKYGDAWYNFRLAG